MTEKSNDAKADKAPTKKPRLRASKRSILSNLGGLFLRATHRLACALSDSQARRLALAISRLALLCTPTRREMARRNIELAFPEKSTRQVEEILRGSYGNMALSLIEFFRLARLIKEERICSVIDLTGEEHLRAALDKGRGVVLLTAHFANWELVGARLVAAGYVLNVLARHQKDRATTDLINRIRELSGMRVLKARNGDSGRILKCLRQNEIVGFLNDQNARRSGILVPFFGRPASTHPGAALIALRSKAPVIPVFGWRNDDGTHTARILPEVDLERTGNLRTDVEKTTILLTKLVEEQIRQRPELWLWLHNRWELAPEQR